MLQVLLKNKERDIPSLRVIKNKVQQTDSEIATFSVRSLVNMFSQNMSNALVHKSEILGAVCETQYDYQGN